MNLPIRQHFIPKVYLKQFKIGIGNRDERVFILDTSSIYHRTPKSKPLNSDYFIGEKYYNSLEFEDNGYALEYQLSKIENNYSSLMAEIESNMQLSSEQKENILLFIVFSKLRSPIWRGCGYKHRRKLKSFIINKESEEITDSLIKNEHLRRFIETDKIYDVLGAVASKQWYIYITKEELPFITSDNPGFSINCNGNILVPNPYWNIKDDTVMFFPLSSKFCLKIVPFPVGTPIEINAFNTPIIYKEVKEEIVDKINFYTYCTRDRLLISNLFERLQIYVDDK